MHLWLEVEESNIIDSIAEMSESEIHDLLLAIDLKVASSNFSLETIKILLKSLLSDFSKDELKNEIEEIFENDL